MQQPDSILRILRYFQSLAAAPFYSDYDNMQYLCFPRLVVSPAVFRSYTCPAYCGGCCMTCTLVWDWESYADLPSILKGCVALTIVELNHVALPWYVDYQAQHRGSKCRHLDFETARCGIYDVRPLPCRLELFKFIHQWANETAYARVQLPGRNWALTRIDGNKGGLCEIVPYDEAMTQSHIKDLLIIKGWMEAYNIENNVDRVVQYLETGPHATALEIDNSKRLMNG